MASASLNDVKVSILDGSNYHRWKIRAEAALTRQKCWNAVSPGFLDANGAQKAQLPAVGVFVFF